jgi:hypothetical protein
MATAARRAKDELAGLKVKAVEQVSDTFLLRCITVLLYLVNCEHEDIFYDLYVPSRTCVCAIQW